jgi:hypothetical protein
MQSACSISYCYLWPVCLYLIFPNYLKNDTILKKILLNIKCVFWFSLKHLCDPYLILRRIRWNIIMNVHTVCLHVKYPLFLWDLNETWIFLKHIKKKYSNIKFHTNPSSVSPVVPYGQTDGHTYTMKLNVAKKQSLMNAHQQKACNYYPLCKGVSIYCSFCSFMWGCVQINGTVHQHNISQTCFSHTFTCYTDWMDFKNKIFGLYNLT